MSTPLPASGGLRIGDRERAAAADRLSAHAAAGRLGLDELEARLERVERAILARDLWAIEADLPRPARRALPAPALPALPLILLVAGVALTVAVGHPVLPLFAAALLVWRFGAVRARPRSSTEPA